MSEEPIPLRALRPRSQQGSKSSTASQKIDINLKNSEIKRKTKNNISKIINEMSTPDELEDLSDIEKNNQSEDDTAHIKDESNVPKSEAVYECTTCKPPKIFKDLQSYLDHYKNKKEHKPSKSKNVINVNPNQCPTCEYVASNLQDFENHQKIHHLKRRFFRCAKCSYMTHVRARYTKHVKYHSMPMIKCNSCDFRTPYKWNLDRHTRNHGGKGPFQCRACNFTADIRQSLTVHETNHHDPPVGQAQRKSNLPFERKPRNSPKRYNQVGASDYRARRSDPQSSIMLMNSDTNITQERSSNVIEDKTSAIANAECITLKCKEKGCQYMTAWNSEMKRHLADCHLSEIACKSTKKPLPMLIPLSPVNTIANNMNVKEPSTLLKVPRVRVKPVLAQIARDTEMAKLYSHTEIIQLKKENNTATDLFEKKNASFFDKLKEKLTTSSSINNGVSEVAINNENDLKCWCTFKASSMEEMTCHKQTHHTALSVSVEDATTQPNRRRVFKCPHCPFWASTASRFHVHIVGHLNRKPFECSLCAYRSNWRWDITKHIKLKAAKDPVHMTARVLMTDETGRRNYSKYNKYLAQVENPSWDDQEMEEKSFEDSQSEELTKFPITPEKEYKPAPELTPAPISDQNKIDEDNMTRMSLRPPPPLKAAAKSSDDTKRTVWKCKRCNFRDSVKEIVLKHVKSHYEPMDTRSNDECHTYDCGDCPFTTSDSNTLSIHRKYHRPNKEAVFKCYLCPFYVGTKSELLDHARLHGEELAVVHQKGLIEDIPSTPTVRDDDKQLKELAVVEPSMTNGTSPNNSVAITMKNNTESPPPLLLDTRALPEAPLVWVSRPDGTIAKMLKCRHCPFICLRRAEVQDHEIMHLESLKQISTIACTDCSFACTRKDVMIDHMNTHTGSLGTVHCLVDKSRTDVEQLDDLATLLDMPHVPKLHSEPDLEDSRLLHCCNKCPARFLCEKELGIHLRYHSTQLAYSCQWCSYAARQPTHLLAHQKAHSSDYQQRTKYLLSLYGNSQRYPPPPTACFQTNTNHESNSSSSYVAWVVVEVPGNLNSGPIGSNEKLSNQVFTCAKCPARYFKLDALEYHMTLHGANNRFKCSHCDYSSKTAQNLMKHQVVHRRQNEPNEIQVPVPNEPSSHQNIANPMSGNPNFVYAGYLKNGRMKEKRYKCQKCPSAFEKREQYKVHLSLHGAKQRYRCETCDYSVKYYANYIQHLKKHQVNAQAQAARRQLEDDSIPIDNVNIDNDVPVSRSGKTLKTSPRPSTPSSILSNLDSSAVKIIQSSNQDKQCLMLMERKGITSQLSNVEHETIMCHKCPYATSDKDTIESHKRRHGIERVTPSCPHCDYVPRKDENIGEHVRLHFNRLCKPESYLIVELLTLTVNKIFSNEKELKKASEVIFQECPDSKFFPATEPTLLHSISLSKDNPFKRKIIIDPNTGEAQQQFGS